jgi:hypothetical protein
VVQPIVVSNDNGSNTANSFGSSQQEAEIKRRINRIYNQAGIVVQWLSAKQWYNTFANGADQNDRPEFEFSQIVSRGDAAGVGSTDASIVDLYFVHEVPGTTNTRTGLNQRGFVGRSGVAVSVNDDFEYSEVENDWLATAISHAIGHNLGLVETDATASNRTLMDTTAAKDITASQILQAQRSFISKSIP